MDDYLNYKSYRIREKVPEEKVPDIIQGMESIPGIEKFKCSGQVISFIYNPAFKMREITLGSAMKDTYVVMDGLEEGEEIVTNGTFSVDAASPTGRENEHDEPVRYESFNRTSTWGNGNGE